MHARCSKTRWFYFIVVVLSQYATFTYRVFSTLMVLLTYLSCAQPFRFSQFMTERRIMQVFFAGHGAVMVLVALALPRVVEGIVIKGNIYIDGVTFLTYFAYVKQFLLMCLLVIMIILYVKSIQRLSQFSKMFSSSSGRNRRNQLLSVLIYCTPPNILMTLTIPREVCMITKGHHLNDTPRYKEICEMSNYIYQLVGNFRFFCASVCTLIAFSDYREPILKAFKKCVLRSEDYSIASNVRRREQELPEKCAKNDTKWIPTAERRLIFKDTKLERRICLD
uniref:G_PROTEIN_RECEP_F1_2 domain-containing protein n=1 Tax=Steinernema glaseri TaxID=37863 RepID=A0A1I7YP04_9BILA